MPNDHLHRIAREGCGVAAFGFVADVGAVGVHGALGDKQLLGDLLVGVSGSDELEDFRFAFGERLAGAAFTCLFLFHLLSVSSFFPLRRKAADKILCVLAPLR